MIMKKILYLTPYFNTFINDQIIKLSAHKEVECFTHFHINLYSYIRSKTQREKFRGTCLENKIKINEFKFIYFPGLPKNLMSWIYPRLLYFISFFYLKGQKFDIIHAPTLYPSGIVAMYLSHKLKIPFVVTSHGLDFYKCLPNVREKRGYSGYNSIEKKIVKQVMTQAKRIIAVSPIFLEDMQSYEPTAKLCIIENSFNNKIFFPGDKHISRQKLKLGKQDKIILAVGNFVKSKGHIYLIEAMKKILIKFPNAVLYIIGQGHLKQDYENLIKVMSLENHVRLIPQQKHSALRLWYQSADVFAFPSIDESFGIVLLEAMACKLPIVAAASQGPLHIINDKKNGLLVKPGDPDNLVEKLIHVICDENISEELSTNGLDRVKEFSSKEDEIISLYEEIMERNK